MNEAALTSQPARIAPAPPELAQFFIPGRPSLQDRRPRTLKHGHAFVVFDPNGDALAAHGNPKRLYAGPSFGESSAGVGLRRSRGAVAIKVLARHGTLGVDLR
jgi:hypothetical protein